MDEFDDLFKNEFFIIDSDDLESVEEKLYGFIFNNGDITFDSNINDLNGEGVYVLVKKSDSQISVFQDFNGSYGLYLYDDGKNFVISNSFNCLVDYLKDKFKLSLNEDFVSLLMSCGLCSMIFKETLVNEIEVIPRNYSIHIDKINKTLKFEKIDYAEHSIDLNSKEGLAILDKWFEKWIGIIRNLKKRTNNIQVGLSGGFDTRIISVLWICANIDLNKIYIKSIDDDNHTHAEDFKIASQIAKEFNFPLNNDVISKEIDYFKDLKTILNLSFYVKLGFNNEMNFRFGKNTEPLYFISGKAGETLRESKLFGGKTPDELVEYISGNSRRRDDSFKNPTKRIVQRTLNNLSEEFNIKDKNSYELTNLVYPEVKCCNHFGKLMVEEYFGNIIDLAPALDPDLHKLKLFSDECQDNYLLVALIFLRYCPKLLEFDIEGNRYIDERTIEYARKINDISPYAPKDYEFISGPELKGANDKNPRLHSWAEVNNYLKNIFNSRKFKMEYMKYLPEKHYYKVSRSIETRNYFPLERAMPAFSILKIVNDIEYSNFKNSNLNHWFDSFELNNYDHDISFDISEALLKYATARIDMKNYGNVDNSIELFDISDENTFINMPKWFKNKKGSGTYITSFKGDLNYKIKCIHDGKLKIFLKTLDIKDANKNRFPIFIDYISLKINGKEYLNRNTLISHNHPFIFEKDVDDGEIISIHVEWLPFNESSNYDVKEDETEDSYGLMDRINHKLFG